MQSVDYFTCLKSLPRSGSEPRGIYSGCLGVFCHHEHEVDVDQVCAAADADDAAL